jgi:hypothetical protein
MTNRAKDGIVIKKALGADGKNSSNQDVEYIKKLLKTHLKQGKIKMQHKNKNLYLISND